MDCKEDVYVRTSLRAVAASAIIACGAVAAFPAATHAESFSFTFANHLADETVRGKVSHWEQGDQQGGVGPGKDMVISKPYNMQIGTNQLQAYFYSADGSATYCAYTITIGFEQSMLEWMAGEARFTCSIVPTSTRPYTCTHASFPNSKGCNFSFTIGR